jgi:hypothetical protein
VSAPPPLPDLLTDDQRRRLSASLERVERALRQIAALAGTGRRDSTALLSRSDDDLPPEFGHAIAGPLAAATGTLGELVEAFRLTGITASDARSVQALVVSSLVVLEEAASRHLRGYGPVHPDLPGSLDPQLQRLHDQVRRIGEALPGRELPRTRP